MRPGTLIFRSLLGIGWLALFAVTIRAVARMGAGAAGPVFFSDFAHPWHAQFDTDLGLHLLLAAAWMVYRSHSLLVGLICAVLAINFGALFTLGYLLVVSIAASGNMRLVLLGARAAAI
jgi:hypothetical protein